MKGSVVLTATEFFISGENHNYSTLQINEVQLSVVKLLWGG
jgi:hypothetical protein